MSITKYHLSLRIIHWLTSVLILTLLVVGFYMHDLPSSPDKYRLYMLHKSIGVISLIFVAIRIYFRKKHGTPSYDDITRWQRIAGKINHYSLYVVLVVFPISGILLTQLNGYSIDMFNLFTLPKIVPTMPTLGILFVLLHKMLAFVIIGLITLHILATLLHVVFQNHRSFIRRMI